MSASDKKKLPTKRLLLYCFLASVLVLVLELVLEKLGYRNNPLGILWFPGVLLATVFLNTIQYELRGDVSTQMLMNEAFMIGFLLDVLVLTVFFFLFVRLLQRKRPERFTSLFDSKH